MLLSLIIMIKFSSKVIPSVFMGYSLVQKGYLLFNLETKTFFVNCDVVFHETVFPFTFPATISSFFPTDDGFNFLHLEPLPSIYIPSLHIVPAPSSSSTLLSTSDTQHPNSRPPLRGTTRSVKTLAWMNDYVCSNQSSASFTTDPRWVAAMQQEIQALEAKGTWEVVSLPASVVPIGCKWVDKIKYNSDGSVERFNDRLVGKGYNQQAGIDFQKTFSPVVKHAIVRTVISLAAIHDWPLFQMDVSMLFCNGICLRRCIWIF